MYSSIKSHANRGFKALRRALFQKKEINSYKDPTNDFLIFRTTGSPKGTVTVSKELNLSNCLQFNMINDIIMR